jgi:hypothetical protein
MLPHISKGPLMIRRYRAMLLPTVAVAVLMLMGCGPSTTNEENLGPTKSVATGGPEIPVFKTYGERQQYEAEQKAKQRAASKDGAGSKGQPKAPQAPPKSQ